MKQKYWFMCYYWYNVFTFGIYDLFGDDIRTVEYCGEMLRDDYTDFEKTIDKKI